MTLHLITILTAALLGAGIARAALGARNIAAFSAMSFGFGAGISSLIYYIYKLTFPAAPAALLFMELIAAAASAILFFRMKPRAAHDIIPTGHEPGGLAKAVLTVALAFTVARLGVSFFSTAARFPYGASDALNVWSFRGVFFATSGSGWRHAFDTGYLTNDFNYPLLLSNFLARNFEYAGRITPDVPALTAAAFTLGAVALLFGALRIFTKNSAPWLAALVLTGTPLFISTGALQMGDVPLSFFILMAVVLYEIHAARGRDNLSAAAAAGLALGLCAWTKNEGLLFAAIFLCVQFAASVFTAGFRASARSTLLVLAGLLPPVIAALHLYSSNGLRSPVTGGLHFIGRMLRPDYWAVLLSQSLSLLQNVMQVNWFMAAAFILAPLVIIKGFRNRNQTSAAAGLLAALLLLSGCVAADFIYPSVTLPAHFGNLLRETLYRFVLQIYPAMIFLIVLILSGGKTAPEN